VTSSQSDVEHTGEPGADGAARRGKDSAAKRGGDGAAKREKDSAARRGGDGAVPGRERGSVTVEVAILAPAFLMLIVLAAVVGRTAVAQNAVDLAAHDAARAGSISRTLEGARADGEVQARARLAEAGLNCGYLEVTLGGIDGRTGRVISLAEAFAVPVGEPVSISSSVVCDVALDDLVGAPGSRRVEASFVSPMDRYRARGVTQESRGPAVVAPERP